MFAEIILEQLVSEYTELLTEDYVYSGNKMTLDVDHNIGRNGYGYFKVYNNEGNKYNAKAMIRVSVSPNPHYEYHRNRGKDPKCEFNMNSTERSILMNILKANNEKVWKELLKAISKQQFKPYKYYPIPDYTQLVYNNKKRKYKPYHK